MQLTKMSTSRISGKGPPLAVSAISHLTIFSLFCREDVSKMIKRGERGQKDVLGNAGLPEEVNRTGSTTSQGSNDQNLYSLLPFLGALQRLTHFLDHFAFIGVRLQFAQLALPILGLLGGKREGTSGGAGETGVETECGDTSVGNGVFEEFEVVEGTLALGESAEDVIPSGLLLVAVGELDVRVREGVAEVARHGELVRMVRKGEMRWVEAG